MNELITSSLTQYSLSTFYNTAARSVGKGQRLEGRD